MDRKTIILAKRIVSRKETLEYAARKFGWKNEVIGVSCYFGFWAWVLARMLEKKCIYYCGDFYSPEHPTNKKFLNKFFCKAAMRMDKFLVRHSDEVWDVSERINEGRAKFGGYSVSSEIVPLSYPPNYFRFETDVSKEIVAFVGLDPNGLELMEDMPWALWWLGKGELLCLDELLEKLSFCGIGLSMWNFKGNNYYGDPGKTKLYSACGLPVIMTDNTPYAKVIEATQAGLVIDYGRISLKRAIKKILYNYDFYKNNVKKTWKYINSDEVFKNSLTD